MDLLSAKSDISNSWTSLTKNQLTKDIVLNQINEIDIWTDLPSKWMDILRQQ